MQPVFDLLPVILFFVAYKLTDIFVATGVLIVAVIVQTGVQWIRHRKVSSMALISAALVLVFGGLTLLIHDKAFIQWKVTVVNWLLAAGLLASHFFGEQPLIQRLLGEHLAAERATWLKLSHAWIAFLLALGGLNLYVAYNFIPRAPGSRSSSSRSASSSCTCSRRSSGWRPRRSRRKAR